MKKSKKKGEAGEGEREGGGGKIKENVTIHGVQFLRYIHTEQGPFCRRNSNVDAPRLMPEGGCGPARG